MERHPHSELIDAVGPREVRERFSISPQVLYNWRVRGIAPLSMFAFAELAAEHGVAMPADFLDVLRPVQAAPETEAAQ